MAKKQAVLTDKVYKLKRSTTPLSYMLQTKSSRRKPLLYFDGQSNRELRYARNQKTPFLDEQDGNAVLEPVIFETGLLYVPKTNPVLQEFLSYHPGNGRIFEVVDSEKDAAVEVETLDYQLEAQIQARDLDLEVLANNLMSRFISALVILSTCWLLKTLTVLAVLLMDCLTMTKTWPLTLDRDWETRH